MFGAVGFGTGASFAKVLPSTGESESEDERMPFLLGMADRSTIATLACPGITGDNLDLCVVVLHDKRIRPESTGNLAVVEVFE